MCPGQMLVYPYGPSARSRLGLGPRPGLHLHLPHLPDHDSLSQPVLQHGPPLVRWLVLLCHKRSDMLQELQNGHSPISISR
jgi:hypothetical protein